MDLDPQGSSLRWVSKRQRNQAPVEAVAAFENDGRTTRSFQLRVPATATHVIVDTPAALEAPQLPDMTRGADKILVPVLSLGHRHSCLLALHSRPAAGGEGAPRG